MSTRPRRPHGSTGAIDDHRRDESLRIVGDRRHERVDVKGRDLEVRIHDDDDVGAALPRSLRAEIDARAEAEVRVRGDEMPACLVRELGDRDTILVRPAVVDNDNRWPVVTGNRERPREVATEQFVRAVVDRHDGYPQVVLDHVGR